MKFNGLLVCVLVVATSLNWVSPPLSSAKPDSEKLKAGIAGPFGPGAAAVVPFLTSQNGTQTLVTVTNTGSTTIQLDVILIEGASYSIEPFSDEQPSTWAVEAAKCILTGNEVVTFTVISSGGGAQIESTTKPDPFLCDVSRTVNTEAGLIFFAVQGDIGNTVLADWVVVDWNNDFAFGADAISFKAGKKVNTDREYVFHTEYSDFPSALSNNFRFPDDGCDLGDADCRAAALLLFTLDGAAGSPPSVQVNIDFYDQFEQPFDTDYSFDCFSLVHFHDISPNLTRDFNPGSDAG